MSDRLRWRTQGPQKIRVLNLFCFFCFRKSIWRCVGEQLQVWQKNMMNVSRSALFWISLTKVLKVRMILFRNQKSSSRVLYISRSIIIHYSRPENVSHLQLQERPFISHNLSRWKKIEMRARARARARASARDWVWVSTCKWGRQTQLPRVRTPANIFSLYFLVRGQYRVVVLKQGISQMQLAVKAWAKCYKKLGRLILFNLEAMLIWAPDVPHRIGQFFWRLLWFHWTYL